MKDKNPRLRTFIRVDDLNQPIPSSSIIAFHKPKIGLWIDATECVTVCCAQTTTTTTTVAPPNYSIFFKNGNLRLQRIISIDGINVNLSQAQGMFITYSTSNTTHTFTTTIPATGIIGVMTYGITGGSTTCINGTNNGDNTATYTFTLTSVNNGDRYTALLEDDTSCTTTTTSTTTSTSSTTTTTTTSHNYTVTFRNDATNGQIIEKINGSTNILGFGGSADYILDISSLNVNFIATNLSPTTNNGTLRSSVFSTPNNYTCSMGIDNGDGTSTYNTSIGTPTPGSHYLVVLNNSTTC